MRCDRKGVTAGVWRNERGKGRGKNTKKREEGKDEN